MGDNDTKRRLGIFERMRLKPRSFVLPTLAGAIVGFMAWGFPGLFLLASLSLLARIAEKDDERFSDGGGDEHV